MGILRYLPYILFSIFLIGCGDKASHEPVSWGEHINQRTQGLVSKESDVRIRFVNDVIDSSLVNTSAVEHVTISPAISGEVVFANTREILVDSEEDLKPGMSYQVAIDTEGLSNIPSGLPPYTFSFDVIPTAYEVKVDDIALGSNHASVEGSIVTADAERASNIENIVSFELPGQTITPQWQHAENGRFHRFFIEEIERTETENSLTISWDGQALGLKDQGRLTRKIPELGAFKVEAINSGMKDRQYIRVLFSDPVDKNQDILGLVQLVESEFTTDVEGNYINIYPQKSGQKKFTVLVEPGIRSASGRKLKHRVEQEIEFRDEAPRVAFVGNGSILPNNKVLSIPFESVNVDSVQVTAFRVFENNIGQFLQSNQFDGQDGLGHVGRYLWRKTILLEQVEKNHVNRFSIDASSLLEAYPGALFRLTLSINPSNSLLDCTNPIAERSWKEKPLVDEIDFNTEENSGWDFAEDYNSDQVWEDRDNPCKDAYYIYSSETESSKNFLASDFGLIAKHGSDNQWHITATSLSDARPLLDTTLDIRNFQGQTITTVKTDADGMAVVKLDQTPFYLIASKNGQFGYLKLNEATALPTSHFDVGGEKLKRGLKGYIYGDRGVWRPGDNIYLTFVAEDKHNIIPDDHPVTMQLFNPKGQLVQTLTNKTPINHFYAFTLKTDEKAETGRWSVKALLGSRVFTKALRIDAVKPNRLQIDLDLGEEVLEQTEEPIEGQLFSQWLHGAIASNLRADIQVRFSSQPTRFSRNADFIFDDPVRTLVSGNETIFEGKLDEKGFAHFSRPITVNSESPGLLKAHFTSRVFEEGGDFSISQSTQTFHPYQNYVGIKLPKGDATRGMLLTDTQHTVEIASLSTKGEPVDLNRVEVSLYKMSWKWWWDKSGEDLSRYMHDTYAEPLQKDIVNTEQGKGLWTFDVKYPDWGRYLVRACDLDGKHCTGKLVYIDWPGWAGRAQEGGGVGANTLSLSLDKERYTVGETAIVSLPKASQGRALISVETGTAVLQQHWFELSENNSQFELPISQAMSPNAYVHVSLIQPHSKTNDRPIRLYGIERVVVDDPETRLQPQLTTIDEWQPNASVNIQVSESQGQPMTYTLALVDEGLLGLTNFKTPDLHQEFYKKEALGVMTWDLYDQVVGAYGGELETLLALGGSDSVMLDDAEQKRKRFPPVVKFLGPFTLGENEKADHQVVLPQYIGALRLMLVAGNKGAYGSVDKRVKVRDDLSLLATVPRVVSPGEEISLPVELFVMNDDIKKVSVSVETSELFEVVGKAKQNISLSNSGEHLGLFKLKVKSALGKGSIKFTAKSGDFNTESEVHLEVRAPNPKQTKQASLLLKASSQLEHKLVSHGIDGTNQMRLDASAIPPFNLQRHVDYLVRYPHGCLEQTTSSVFPQLYLPGLVNMSPERREAVNNNINNGIDRLRMFQLPNGSFVYWPGGWSSGPNEWANTYAGHFLIEAQLSGYYVAPDMINKWIDAQRRFARQWATGDDASRFNQSYRLYTLALAQKAEIGAMNRLRENTSLSSVEKWLLAAAYASAGLKDAANQLIAMDKRDTQSYTSAGDTFGSALRDKAIILNSLLALDNITEAKALAEEIAAELYQDQWQSTQTLAYSLMALSRYAVITASGDSLQFSYELNQQAETVVMDMPVYLSESVSIDEGESSMRFTNDSDKDLYITVLTEGVPLAGNTLEASSGLSLALDYQTVDGEPLDEAALTQGQDFIAGITITNTSGSAIDNLALTYMVAAGWQIHNPLFSGEEARSPSVDYLDVRDDRVLYYLSLPPNEPVHLSVLMNASYLGKYFLPAVSVSGMYDSSFYAHTKGKWVEVKK